jgi:hypothetical protein
MDEVVIRGSPARIAIMGAPVIVGLVVYALWHGWSGRGGLSATGYGCLGLALVFAALFAVPALRPPTLRLGLETFECRSLWGGYVCPWSEIEQFRSASPRAGLNAFGRLGSVIGIDYRAGSAAAQSWTASRGAFQNIYACDWAVRNFWALADEELVKLLNDRLVASRTA